MSERQSAECDAPCCTACDGAGADTNGICWDCRGTGHPHPRRHDGDVDPRPEVWCASCGDTRCPACEAERNRYVTPSVKTEANDA